MGGQYGSRTVTNSPVIRGLYLKLAWAFGALGVAETANGKSDSEITWALYRLWLRAGGPECCGGTGSHASTVCRNRRRPRGAKGLMALEEKFAPA